MTDTIELLETIGSDASLRYAQADALKALLEQAQASVELAEAVALGDGAPLRKELKLQETTQVQQMHAPGHDDEDECDPPVPERRQPDKAPANPPAKQSR